MEFTEYKEVMDAMILPAIKRTRETREYFEKIAAKLKEFEEKGEKIDFQTLDEVTKKFEELSGRCPSVDGPQIKLTMQQNLEKLKEVVRVRHVEMQRLKAEKDALFAQQESCEEERAANLDGLQDIMLAHKVLTGTTFQYRGPEVSGFVENKALGTVTPFEMTNPNPDAMYAILESTCGADMQEWQDIVDM